MMIITHDHRVSVSPPDSFGRRYIFLVKESCERKGYACRVTESTIAITAQWQEAFINEEKKDA